MKGENQTQASIPQKRIEKYTVDEVLKSLHYECCDADDGYDGLLHIISDINGMKVKVKIADIIHETAKYQNK